MKWNAIEYIIPYEFLQWMLHNLLSDEKDIWGCTKDAEHVSNADFSGRMETDRRLTLKIKRQFWFLEHIMRKEG